jgi:hypothetical protein
VKVFVRRTRSAWRRHHDGRHPKTFTTAEVIESAEFASEIEALSCHLAGIISRHTDFANVRPHGVDRARRRDADVSHKGRTAIAVTPHSSLFVIDIPARDSPEVGVAF